MVLVSLKTIVNQGENTKYKGNYYKSKTKAEL